MLNGLEGYQHCFQFGQQLLEIQSSSQTSASSTLVITALQSHAIPWQIAAQHYIIGPKVYSPALRHDDLASTPHPMLALPELTAALWRALLPHADDSRQPSTICPEFDLSHLVHHGLNAVLFAPWKTTDSNALPQSRERLWPWSLPIDLHFLTGKLPLVVAPDSIPAPGILLPMSLHTYGQSSNEHRNGRQSQQKVGHHPSHHHFLIILLDNIDI